jgi:DnaJ-class molecular chaperone
MKRRKMMYINRITCANCYGTGKTQQWVATEPIDKYTGAFRLEDSPCDTCKGKGYTTYPVFTVEEAKVIAKHFGFEVIGDENE